MKTVKVWWLVHLSSSLCVTEARVRVDDCYIHWRVRQRNNWQGWGPVCSWIGPTGGWESNRDFLFFTFTFIFEALDGQMNKGTAVNYLTVCLNSAIIPLVHTYSYHQDDHHQQHVWSSKMLKEDAFVSVITLSVLQSIPFFPLSRLFLLLQSSSFSRGGVCTRCSCSPHVLTFTFDILQHQPSLGFLPRCSLLLSVSKNLPFRLLGVFIY